GLQAETMSPATATPSAPEAAAAAAKLPQQPASVSAPTATDAASSMITINTPQHAAVPPTRAWKVPEQLALNKT
ncbi:hypothetical protein GGI16_008599, partial [Coemansia sp. S142-1]